MERKTQRTDFLLSRQGKGGSLVEQDFRNSKEGPLKKRLKKAFWNDVIDQGEDEALVVAKKKNIFFQEDPLLIQREMVALPKPSKHKKNRHKHIEEKKKICRFVKKWHQQEEQYLSTIQFIFRGKVSLKDIFF